MDENKKADYVKGMFAGATFNNSVVVGIAESGSTVSYESQQKKPQEDGDDSLLKQGKGGHHGICGQAAAFGEGRIPGEVRPDMGGNLGNQPGESHDI